MCHVSYQGGKNKYEMLLRRMAVTAKIVRTVIRIVGRKRIELKE